MQRGVNLMFTPRCFVTSAGFKPTTFGTGIRRSIQLNYEAVLQLLSLKRIWIVFIVYTWRCIA